MAIVIRSAANKLILKNRPREQPTPQPIEPQTQQDQEPPTSAAVEKFQREVKEWNIRIAIYDQKIADIEQKIQDYKPGGAKHQGMDDWRVRRRTLFTQVDKLAAQRGEYRRRRNQDNRNLNRARAGLPRVRDPVTTSGVVSKTSTPERRRRKMLGIGEIGEVQLGGAVGRALQARIRKEAAALPAAQEAVTVKVWDTLPSLPANYERFTRPRPGGSGALYVPSPEEIQSSQSNRLAIPGGRRDPFLQFSGATRQSEAINLQNVAVQPSAPATWSEQFGAFERKASKKIKPFTPDLPSGEEFYRSRNPLINVVPEKMQPFAYLAATSSPSSPFGQQAAALDMYQDVRSRPVSSTAWFAVGGAFRGASPAASRLWRRTASTRPARFVARSIGKKGVRIAKTSGAVGLFGTIGGIEAYNIATAADPWAEARRARTEATLMYGGYKAVDAPLRATRAAQLTLQSNRRFAALRKATDQPKDLPWRRFERARYSYDIPGQTPYDSPGVQRTLRPGGRDPFRLASMDESQTPGILSRFRQKGDVAQNWPLTFYGGTPAAQPSLTGQVRVTRPFYQRSLVEYVPPRPPPDAPPPPPRLRVWREKIATRLSAIDVPRLNLGKRGSYRGGFGGGYNVRLMPPTTELQRARPTRLQPMRVFNTPSPTKRAPLRLRITPNIRTSTRQGVRARFLFTPNIATQLNPLSVAQGARARPISAPTYRISQVQTPATIQRYSFDYNFRGGYGSPIPTSPTSSRPPIIPGFRIPRTPTRTPPSPIGGLPPLGASSTTRGRKGKRGRKYRYTRSLIANVLPRGTQSDITGLLVRI